jgi:hypothetical protein
MRPVIAGHATTQNGGAVRDEVQVSGVAPASPSGLPLVVPVVSGAGGVGRSTLAALLAMALSDRTDDPGEHAVAVCDVSPRASSPWPGWVDHTAASGTGWLAACVGEPDQFDQEIKRSTSALDRDGAQPVWVLTDTGPLNPAFDGAYAAPLIWAPLLRYVRAAVIDADAFEGSRLARQGAGGPLSTAAAWMTVPSARSAAVWVTDPGPVGMTRTLEAVTAAERCGLPMSQFVVAVNDVRGHGWLPRSRSRRTLLADRVGAIAEVGHHAALRDGARPHGPACDAAGRDIARLADAVAATAGPAPLSPVPVAAPSAERMPPHAAPVARSVPALS